MAEALPENWRVDTAWDRADLTAAHAYLVTAYWCEGIPLDLLERAMRSSLNFVLRDETGRLRGYARAITDQATFAYLCDVFVEDGLRGRGLGDALIAAVMAHPALQGLRRFSLFTRDAHGLYARHGFQPLATPDRGMEVVRPGLYLQNKEESK
ncbi:GNAT family N-acetyltransferase [Pelomonas sp. SE-A7]|uniref:GNAT family N-acetyltransferase n=1 Tax=Pelomonas sp. SE-A7 TaxID=3054953 RepID=UPI00259D207F|nr:GNAT family N-acetyltransferase [Pelomonas sp. SE-A7]MDM4768124.1 GNAT family N-acetyltransferase [Pelomonas sp. SE-A7]